MSERPDEAQGADAQEARRALLDAAAPGADAAFRSRLKRDFVTGAIEVTGTSEARGRARRKNRPFPIGGPRARPGTWVAAAVAAAAALLIVVGTLNQGHRWWVTGVRGTGEVRIDGEYVSLADREGLNRLLIPGAEVLLPDGAEVDVCSDGMVALQLTRRAELTLPPPPARWINRRTEIHVRYGDVRVTTGPKFRGSHLEVVTPDAAVDVTGTTLAVIVQTNGTCVCVLEGAAQVGRMVAGRPDDMRPVPGGRLRFVWKGDRPPSFDVMRESERKSLAAFRDSQQPWLEGAPTPD